MPLPPNPPNPRTRNLRTSYFPNKKLRRFEFLKVIFPYFDSEWSFAQFRITDMKGLATFGHEPNTIIVISYEGNYYYARFDPVNGGECLKQQQNKLAAAVDLD